MRQNKLITRQLSAILLILLAGVIVYANSLQVPFVFDDKRSIPDNPVIRSLDNYYANSVGQGEHPTRVVGYLTFALNYRFGGLDVTGYHAVNLMIHLATALLVYALLRLTFRTPFFQVPDPGSRVQGLNTHLSSFILQPSFFIPLFAALLFVAHPVQTQAVTYIVQRLTSLATLFYLLSVVLYVKARLRLESRVPGPESKVPSRHPRNSKDLGPGTLDPGPWTRGMAPIFLLAGATVAAVLAMQTKEIAFTLPCAVLLYEVFFFRGNWKRRLLFLLPILLTTPIIPATMLMSGEAAGDLLSDVSEQSRVQTEISRFDYFFTQLRVIVTYLRLLVLPVNQNLDYDYPVYTTFFTPPVFLSFLLLAALFSLAVYLIFTTRPPSTLNAQPSTRSADPALRLVSFGLLWFFLTLAVESSFVPILDVIFEHRVYLPSVGAALAFSSAFYLVSGRLAGPAGRKLTLGVASLCILTLSLAAHQRNQVWGNEIRLWEDAIRKSPRKARPYNNLGVALGEADRPWEAIEALSRAIRLDPEYVEAYNNLGHAYLLTGQSGAAIPVLQTAIRLKPDNDDAYISLGAALVREGHYREAATLLELGLDSLGGRAETHFNLGLAYAHLGNQEAARREWEILSRLDPGLAAKLAGQLR